MISHSFVFNFRAKFHIRITNMSVDMFHVFSPGYPLNLEIANLLWGTPLNDVTDPLLPRGGPEIFPSPTAAHVHGKIFFFIIPISFIFLSYFIIFPAYFLHIISLIISSCFLIFPEALGPGKIPSIPPFPLTSYFLQIFSSCFLKY